MGLLAVQWVLELDQTASGQAEGEVEQLHAVLVHLHGECLDQPMAQSRDRTKKELVRSEQSLQPVVQVFVVL